MARLSTFETTLKNAGTPESDICLDCTSLQSVKNLCSWCDAASICLRVSISSRRSAHDSFSPSFHSAMVAASEWPQSIISFTILFICSMRCRPMLLVSEANLVNVSWSTWNTHKPHNTPGTGHEVVHSVRLIILSSHPSVLIV